MLVVLMGIFAIGGVIFAQQGGGAMQLTSSAFENNASIPKKYTCQGQDINPPLTVGAIPSGTKSLALIVDDPDAPMGTWIHWVVFNIVPADTIAENSIPGTQGYNSFGRNDYGGPCPPSGTHRYVHKVYALDALLNLQKGTSKRQLEETMRGHILAETTLIGLYK